MLKHFFSVVAAVVVGVSALRAATDWPQWQGPNRTRISQETGLLKNWPASGPRVVWTGTGLGAGYGSMAVVGDRVFVQGTRGGRSVVLALNRPDGKEVWSKALGQSETDDRGPGRAARPRWTAIGSTRCPRAAIWPASRPTAPCSGSATSSAISEAGSCSWLVSESPLVDGAHVIVSPGGPGAGIVKLDKMTGSTVWTTKELSDPAGYSSVIAAVFKACART
jgi:hypothetical protein